MIGVRERLVKSELRLSHTYVGLHKIPYNRDNRPGHGSIALDTKWPPEFIEKCKISVGW
ncbi:hypothetical protein [Paenibacillus antarcticus]|uniref:hypothetical protein n=1 Tax=Paenibacillus antarcticus TaxID=253703 RepID=UPI000AD1A792|nr:hypothetical protein [Paenibacillus antarcticus]